MTENDRPRSFLGSALAANLIACAALIATGFASYFAYDSARSARAVAEQAASERVYQATADADWNLTLSQVAGPDHFLGSVRLHRHFRTAVARS